MKKLLILAYDFPPYVSVGGLRPYNWYKHLNEFGVEPIVITRQWDNKYGNHLDYIAPGSSDETIVEKTKYGTIIRTPYKPNLANKILLKYGATKFRLLRKTISAFYEFGQYLFPVGTKIELYKVAKKYLSQNKVDAIIATGEPFILFKYANKLSKQYAAPWIADYRDPWSNNQANNSSFIKRNWHKFFEKKYVSHAQYITTVSEFCQQKIAQNSKNTPFCILPNGYDAEIMDRVKAIKQDSAQLSIAFVGTIYKWHPVRHFLKTVEVFLKENPNYKLKLKFYGTNIPDKLQEFVTKDYSQLKEIIEIIPKMPNADLLRNLAKDNVMLLFNYYSYMGTKIYDYLGIQRKILLCFENDKEANLLKEKYYHMEEIGGISNRLQAELVEKTNSGIVVQNADHLKTVLSDLCSELQNSGQIACHSVGVENYSRKIQVEKLAKIIKEMY